MLSENVVVAVVGLGYVGLPLAVEFGKRYKTIGYDLSEKKIAHYRDHCDPTGEVPTSDLKSAVHLYCTTVPVQIAEADFVVIAVPTPVDSANIPNFDPLVSASTIVGRHLKRGAIVVYESTVYPGATEEICVPVLEEYSKLQWKRDFHIGYSPERINPGDKEHTLTKIQKVVSGDAPDTLEQVAALYESVITAGVHRASSIKVAEAAKVIENTQRDLNIALMNELALIFDKLGIRTSEVLEAAGTKWNFLKFKPGLVGGHCIGVDPHYLTHKAQMLGYHPQVILAGRRINDGMGRFVAEKLIRLLINQGSPIRGAQVNVLGLTFKEDCTDLRNSKVPDIIEELKSYGILVHVHDPLADNQEAQHEYGIGLSAWQDLPQADALVVAVAHQAYRQMETRALLEKIKPVGCIADVKAVLDPAFLPSTMLYWRL